MLTEYVKDFPYSIPSRWYKVFIESDGSNASITTADVIQPTIASDILKFPAGFHIMEVMYDINADAAGTLTPNIKTYADESQGVTLPTASTYDYCTVYVYGYQT